jgi:hypothetical protein
MQNKGVEMNHQSMQAGMSVSLYLCPKSCFKSTHYGFTAKDFEAASDDVVSLARWTLESLQSYFTKIKGRWIPRPVAEIATQDCQNICEPCMHEGS